MTQITELKMLLDIGRHGHRLYDFVFAMLIASISMLIFVGMLMMYVGNLRNNRRERKPGGWRQRLKQCLLCRYRVGCFGCGCCSRLVRGNGGNGGGAVKGGDAETTSTRPHSYMCVPLGVGAPENLAR